MDRLFRFVIAVAGGAGALAQIPPATQPGAFSTTQPSSAPAIAAIVDGHAILEADVEALVQERTPPDVLDSPGAASLMEHYRKNVRELLIDRFLLDREAQRRGVRLTDADMARDMEEELRAYLSDNGLTREEFAEQLRRERGQTIEQFLAQRVVDPEIRRIRLHARLIQSRFPEEVRVSDEEIRSFYEKNAERRYTRPDMVRASQILIATSQMGDDEKAAARRRAEQIRTELLNGADFTTLARQHSDCPSKHMDGDLGWFPRKGTQVEAIAEAAFNLRVGQISDIVESPLGYHIIKLTGRQDARRISLDQARYGIQLFLEAQKINRLKKQLAGELRAAARIEYPQGDPPEQIRRSATQPN